MAEHNDLDFINLNDIKTSPDLIPESEQHLKIVDMEVKETKAKDGHYVNYRAVIQSGPFAGRSIFSMWSLKETALWRMKKDFKALGYQPEGGVPRKSDLLGLEGIAIVGVKPETDEYEASNNVKRWVAPLK